MAPLMLSFIYLLPAEANRIFRTDTFNHFCQTWRLSDLAIKNCSKAVELNPSYLKALLRRAEIYEETEKLGDLDFFLFEIVNIGMMFTCSFQVNCL